MQKSEIVKKFAKDNFREVFFANIETLVSSVFSLIFLSVLSNIASKLLFAEVNYFLTILMFVNALVIFGSDNVLLEADRNFREFHKNLEVFWFRLINVCLIGLVCMIFFDFQLDHFIFLLSPLLVLYEKNKINQKNSRIFPYRLIFLVTVFVIKIAIIKYQYFSLIKFSLLLEYSFGVWLISKRLLAKSYWPGFSKYLTIFQKSLPYALSSIAVMMFSRLDQLLIPSLLNLEVLADYSVAIRVGDSLNFILVVSTLVLAKKYLGKINKLKLSYKIMALTGFLLMILLAAIGPFIIKHLFIDYYNSQVLSLFWLHLVNLPFVALGLVQTRYLAVNKMSKWLPFRFLFGAIVNILFVLLLLPIIGLIGAVISTILAQFATNIVYPYMFSELKPLRVV